VEERATLKLNLPPMTTRLGLMENGIAAESKAAKSQFGPKNKLGPQRKRARRACFACQRSHLSCGMIVSAGVA
jgi:hypothetical protein